MAELDRMAAELMEALDKLENLALPLADVRARAADDAAEIEGLKRERDQLLARIAELEDEARTITGVTGEVEGRLDEAITEIRAALAR
jgi:chromosome segregation ATPase